MKRIPKLLAAILVVTLLFSITVAAYAQMDGGQSTELNETSVIAEQFDGEGENDAVGGVSGMNYDEEIPATGRYTARFLMLGFALLLFTSAVAFVINRKLKNAPYENEA